MIRGTKRSCVSGADTQEANKNKVDLALMAKLHNRWDVEVVDAATGEVKQRARGYNVILNRWWSVVPNGSGPSWMLYGRGTGTPSASDTGLFSRIGTISSIGGTLDQSTLDQGFISWQYAGQLGPSDAVGETITEVGLSTGSSNSEAVTHAMLTDMNGNPISIIKTATDIVHIYATVFLHIVTDRYANGKIRLTTQVSWMRGLNLGSTYHGVRLYQTMNYTENNAVLKFSSKNYDAATKTMALAFQQATVSTANYTGGLLMMIFGKIVDSYYGYEAWLVMFPAGKSQILSEAIGTGNGTTQDYKTKFAFPTDATVYVDGVAQTSGVTVFADHPTQSSRLDRFLAPIAMLAGPDKLVIWDNFVVSDHTGKAIAAGAEVMYEKTVDGLVIDWLVFSGATAAGNVTIYASDDLETWTDVGSTMSSSTWWTIPAPYNAAKYYKVRNNKGSSITLSGGARSGYDGYAIRFDSPPAAGAVITADYKTPMIPKDDNHLMDVSMSVTFGEYTGEEI